jgi:hypothetical protein
MLEDTLKERGNNYGNFHTQANLSQTLSSIISQHYKAIHVNESGEVEPMPQFMAEAIHMICHKLARISNGNPYYVDSWQDIAGYSQLVVDILEENKKKIQLKAAQEAAQESLLKQQMQQENDNG